MPELVAWRQPASRHDFERSLLDFISGPLSIRRRSGHALVRIDASTPLFESGLVDSLAIIDLLAFVEAATGKRIPLRQIEMRYFGTVGRIAHAFWPESGDDK
jgi:acyl carrier protein